MTDTESDTTISNDRLDTNFYNVDIFNKENMKMTNRTTYLVLILKAKDPASGNKFAITSTAYDTMHIDSLPIVLTTP